MANESEVQPGAPKVLRIRKYPNRRYYDSTRSRHLTLAEIYAAVREEYEIEVTDSKTGDDITAKVLAQMIIELDPPKLDVFPVRLLHRLLRANEQLVSDFTKKYFNQALEAFLDSQKKFEQSLRNALGLKSSTPTVADWAKLMWVPSVWGLPGQRDSVESNGSNGTNGSNVAAASELQQLRDQVADLQKRLRKPERRRRAAMTKKKSSK